MKSKPCAGCGLAFHPRPQSPKQAYCPAPACQRERRRRWQRRLMILPRWTRGWCKSLWFQCSTGPRGDLAKRGRYRPWWLGRVLAYSRRLFVQYYPCYTRFEAKQFLLEAARFMAGTCPVCVIDNTSRSPITPRRASTSRGNLWMSRVAKAGMSNQRIGMPAS